MRWSFLAIIKSRQSRPEGGFGWWRLMPPGYGDAACGRDRRRKTPHPPPSGAPSHQANGGVSFNTADPPRGRLAGVRHSIPRTHQGEGLGDKKKRPGALLLALFISFWQCRSGRSETGATGRRRGLRRGRRSWGPRWAAPRAGRSSSRRSGVFPPTWPADAGDASPAY